MFNFKLLLCFILISTAFASHNSGDSHHDSHHDSDDHSSDDHSSDDDSSSEEETCPCIRPDSDADFEETTGFYYIIATTSDDDLRCSHIVIRNSDDGVQTFTKVDEFEHKKKKRIIQGTSYKINDGKSFSISNSNDSAALVTILKADYNRDKGYVLVQECVLGSITQTVCLLSRTPDNKRIDLDDLDDIIDDLIDSNEFNDLKRIPHDEHCKYIYDTSSEESSGHDSDSESSGDHDHDNSSDDHHHDNSSDDHHHDNSSGDDDSDDNNSSKGDDKVVVEAAAANIV